MEKVEICGATFFEGAIDGGAHIDNCKVHIFTELDFTQGRAFGRGTHAYKGLTAAEYPPLMKAFEEAQRRGVPCMAEVDIVRVLTSKGPASVLKRCVPLPLPPIGSGSTSVGGAAASGSVTK